MCECVCAYVDVCMWMCVCGCRGGVGSYSAWFGQIDLAVGRVRSLLAKHGVADHTWVSITSDNGPEVNPAGGQGTGNYENPGLTGGLRGRKRDATEGGTRVIGLVEYPPAVAAHPGGRQEKTFPIAVMDLVPSVLDATGQSSYESRPLDGISLLPVLRGDMPARPAAAGIGIHGDFPYGDTNHQLNPWSQKLEVPFRCPSNSSSAALGDVPEGFESAGNGPQVPCSYSTTARTLAHDGPAAGTLL